MSSLAGAVKISSRSSVDDDGPRKTGMKDRNEALRGIPLFQNLDERDLAEIAGLLIDRKFPRDAVIYEDGSIGDYMYIIQEGQVRSPRCPRTVARRFSRSSDRATFTARWRCSTARRARPR
jgi:hypothetical protein